MGRLVVPRPLTESEERAIKLALEFAKSEVYMGGIYQKGRIRTDWFVPKCCGLKMHVVDLLYPRDINGKCKEHKHVEYVRGATVYVCQCPECTEVRE